jgi:hypothetical protein
MTTFRSEPEGAVVAIDTDFEPTAAWHGPSNCWSDVWEFGWELPWRVVSTVADPAGSWPVSACHSMVASLEGGKPDEAPRIQLRVLEIAALRSRSEPTPAVRHTEYEWLLRSPEDLAALTNAASVIKR